MNRKNSVVACTLPVARECTPVVADRSSLERSMANNTDHLVNAVRQGDLRTDRRRA